MPAFRLRRFPGALPWTCYANRSTVAPYGDTYAGWAACGVFAPAELLGKTKPWPLAFPPPTKLPN